MATSSAEQLKAELPEGSVARSAEIARIIIGQRSRVSAPFTTVENRIGNLVGRFTVSARALTLDGVRVSMSQRDQSKVAEALGAHLLTPKLVQLINQKADVRLVPKPQPWFGGAGGDNSMGTKRRVFDFDGIVNKEVGSRSLDGKLVANEGKDWVIEGYAFTPAGLQRGTNYGWFLPSGQPIQGVGRAHNLDHVDYSQLARFVSSKAQVSQDGGASFRTMTLKDIVADPNLYKLASGEVLPDMKHPGLGTGQPVLQKESSPPKPLPPPSAPPIGTKPATPSQPTTGAKPVSGQPQRTKKGDKGAAVVAWQKFLLSKGYDLGPSGADGDHGNATEKASLDWESKGGKGSAAGTAGGFPDLGIALVVVVAGVGAGWLGYDFMESRK